MAERLGAGGKRDVIGEVVALTGARRASVAWAWHVAPRLDSTLYRVRIIPKRDGSDRILQVPCNALRGVQRAILRKVLAKVPMNEACHGFICGRSTVTNARPHAGKQLVMNLDLKDFFPTVTAARVYGITVGWASIPPWATS